MFRGGKENPFRYGKMVDKMQRQDAELSFPSEDDGGINEDLTVSQAGLTKGLVLVLDSHSDRVSSGTVSDIFRGFVATIEGHDEYPLTSRSSKQADLSHLDARSV